MTFDEARGSGGQAVAGGEERRQRLTRYATWTAEGLAEFNEALAAQRTIEGRDWGTLKKGHERSLR